MKIKTLFIVMISLLLLHVNFNAYAQVTGVKSEDTSGFTSSDTPQTGGFFRDDISENASEGEIALNLLTGDVLLKHLLQENEYTDIVRLLIQTGEAVPQYYLEVPENKTFFITYKNLAILHQEWPDYLSRFIQDLIDYSYLRLEKDFSEPGTLEHNVFTRFKNTTVPQLAEMYGTPTDISTDDVPHSVASRIRGTSGRNSPNIEMTYRNLAAKGSSAPAAEQQPKSVEVPLGNRLFGSVGRGNNGSSIPTLTASERIKVKPVGAIAPSSVPATAGADRKAVAQTALSPDSNAQNIGTTQSSYQVAQSIDKAIGYIQSYLEGIRTKSANNPYDANLAHVERQGKQVLSEAKSFKGRISELMEEWSGNLKELSKTTNETERSILLARNGEIKAEIDQLLSDADRFFEEALAELESLDQRVNENLADKEQVAEQYKKLQERTARLQKDVDGTSRKTDGMSKSL